MRESSAIARSSARNVPRCTGKRPSIRVAQAPQATPPSGTLNPTRPGADGINRGNRYVRIALVHDEDVLAAALPRLAECLGPAAGAGRPVAEPVLTSP